MHALIIEDECMIAMVIEDILRDLGFTTFDVAPSPDMAIEAAAQRCPDLITSDVQLRPGCGIRTVIKICESMVVPFIFITGDVADVKRRLPTSRALSKPFTAEQLFSEVTAALA